MQVWNQPSWDDGSYSRNAGNWRNAGFLTIFKHLTWRLILTQNCLVWENLHYKYHTEQTECYSMCQSDHGQCPLGVSPARMAQW